MFVLGDGIGCVEFIDSAGSDLSVVRAARVSYMNDTDVFNDIRDTKLIAYLIRHNHGSPLEHNMITFRIKAPLFVIQEMLRHRIGVSFNQQSGRYTAFAPEFYMPSVFREQSKTNKQGSDGALDDKTQEYARGTYEDATAYAYAAYEALLNLGVPREQARGVLPHSTYSSLYVTFNLRSLMHFLELRLAPEAQYEIRQYAEAFLEIAREKFPVSIQAWEEIRDSGEKASI